MPIHVKATGTDPNIDPNILMGVGRILFRWARLENLFNADVRMLMDDPRAADLRQEMPINFRRRVVLWKRLVRAVCAGDTAMIQSARNIACAALRANKERNTLFHSHWSAEKGPNEIHLASFRDVDGKTVYEQYMVNAEIVTSIGDQIKNIHDAMISFQLNCWFFDPVLRAQRSGEPEP